MEIKQVILRDLETDLTQLKSLTSIDPQLILVFGLYRSFCLAFIESSTDDLLPQYTPRWL